jgi:protein-tyrosine phosphatase
MSTVIDLHSHVLPGIDDGASDLEESVAIVRAAAFEGTTALAATPHLRADYPTVHVNDLADAVARVNERVPADLGIRVIPAAEVDLLWAQTATEEDLRLASFDQRGSDLLVETPYGSLPDHFEDLLFRLEERGFRILLAHPERSVAFQRDPARLARLVERGVLIQITLPSLVSANGRSRARGLAFDLIRAGLAHNIASDAHSPGPVRPPRLGAGVHAAAHISPGRAEWMVTDAPAAILAGEPLPPPPVERARPERPRRRASRLGRLLGRSA